MANNITFTMIKPEAVANGLSGKIIDAMIEGGFKVKAMKLKKLSKESFKTFKKVFFSKFFIKRH